MKNDNIQAIERDLEETRARTESTIQALQDKLQPRAVIDEATRFFKGTDSGAYAEDVTRAALAQARENPLPLILMGAGAALLATKRPGRPKYIHDTAGAYAGDSLVAADAEYAAAYEDSRELETLYDAEYEDTHRIVGSADAIDRTYTRLDDEDEDAYQNRLYEARGKAFSVERKSGEDEKSFRKRIDDRLSSAKAKAKEYGERANSFRRRQTDRASGLYHKAGERSHSLYEGGRDRAGAFASGTRDRAGAFAHGTADRAGDLAHGTQDAARRGVEKTTDFYESNPLAAALVAVAAGALTGSFFHSTRQERRALGGVGHDINEAAQRLNEQANRKVAEYAEATEEFVEEMSGEAKAAEDRLKEKASAETAPNSDKSGYTPASQTTSNKSTS
ncbi:DUF3618 domain-containing protein [Parvularcula oceani]|uniref:DUF3618 domain-containing protein n=1 Tax=Parvularcula oceani TaxID=1247963 RepID=UPI0004E20527|nr:DUF3618 domain-containing protein [Parvularcula oceani]